MTKSGGASGYVLLAIALLVAVGAAAGLYLLFRSTLATDATAPGAPNGFAVTAQTGTTLTFTWNSMTAATQYEISVRVSGSTSEPVPYTVSPQSGGTCAYTAAGLQTNTTYTVELIAEVASVNSESSTLTAMTGPGAAEDLTCSDAQTTSLTVHWYAPNDADSSDTYSVSYRVNGTSAWTAAARGVAYSTSQISSVVTGLIETTAYDFQVLSYRNGVAGQAATLLDQSTYGPPLSPVSATIVSNPNNGFYGYSLVCPPPTNATNFATTYFQVGNSVPNWQTDHTTNSDIFLMPDGKQILTNDINPANGDIFLTYSVVCTNSVGSSTPASFAMFGPGGSAGGVPALITDQVQSWNGEYELTTLQTETEQAIAFQPVGYATSYVGTIVYTTDPSVAISTVTSTEPLLVFTGLPPGMDLTINFCGTNAEYGNGETMSYGVTTVGSPPPPSNLNVINPTTNSVTATWDTLTGADHYTIILNDLGGQQLSDPVEQPSGSTQSFTFTNLPVSPNANGLSDVMLLKVQTCNSVAQTSSFIQAACCLLSVTNSALPVPSNPAITARGPTSVSVSFTPNLLYFAVYLAINAPTTFDTSPFTYLVSAQTSPVIIAAGLIANTLYDFTMQFMDFQGNLGPPTHTLVVATAA
jgi:hypothetical protein